MPQTTSHAPTPTLGRAVAGRNPWAVEIGATLALGWPLILTNLAQVTVSAVNMMMIGRLGAQELAAAVLAASLYQSLTNFCMGLVSATMPMIAMTLGRNRHSVREVRRTVRQGFWSAVVICVPMWFVMWHADRILLAMGQDPAVAAQAVPFMHTLQWGLLPNLGFIVLRSFLAAVERPLWTLAVALAAIAFNAALGWLLIFGPFGLPPLGLAGAGLASTGANLVMLVGSGLIVTRHRRFRRYHLFGRFWRPDWPRFVALWRIGLPMALTFAFETATFYAAVMVMGLIGPVALAAHAIVFQVATVNFMVPLGLGQVATVRVGRAFGAGDPEGVRRAGWSAYGLGVGFMALMATLMLLAPRLLIGIFLDLEDPANAATVATSITFMAFAALFQVVDGAQAVCAGMLRGLGDTRVPMILAAIGYWVIGAPCGAYLAFRIGGGGVYLGLAAGLATVAGLMTLRWIARTARPHAGARA